MRCLRTCPSRQKCCPSLLWTRQGRRVLLGPESFPCRRQHSVGTRCCFEANNHWHVCVYQCCHVTAGDAFHVVPPILETAMNHVCQCSCSVRVKNCRSLLGQSFCDDVIGTNGKPVVPGISGKHLYCCCRCCWETTLGVLWLPYWKIPPSYLRRRFLDEPVGIATQWCHSAPALQSLSSILAFSQSSSGIPPSPY